MKLSVAGLIICLSLTSAHAADFTASLDGAQEVPPVETNATGSASFTFFRLFGSDFLLTIRTNTRLSSPIVGAHIHVGTVGEDGDIALDYSNGSLLDLFFLGININTDADLEGPLEGQTLSDLQDEMTAGNTYINIHTVNNTGGEIRGQIAAVE